LFFFTGVLTFCSAEIFVNLSPSADQLKFYAFTPLCTRLATLTVVGPAPRKRASDMFRGLLDTISPLVKAAGEAARKVSQQVVGHSDLLADMDAASESSGFSVGSEAIRGIGGGETVGLS
jgi:hypothetical protein